ncbi:MAG: sugar phosphate isomerase/epimerase [Magnetospirillum sp.]|nr:sugar phosphate isomerase/epimerase [Magnetospirillum sp.]
MKLCASNLALPAFDHLGLLPEVKAMGLDGIEIAPTHTWVDPNQVSAAEVTAYRQAAETAGLAVVGLHGVLDGEQDLGMFTDTDTQKRTIDTLAQRSALCRDLGGRTLILGARWVHDLPEREAWKAGRAFLERLLPRIEAHGTILCLAPLAPEQGDFCATAKSCYLLTNAVDHPALGLHLSAAALAATGEMGHATFAAVRGRLDHFHADEPDLVVAGSTGRIDHADLRRHLAAISYFGWVSVVQKQLSGLSLEALRRGTRFVADTYLPIDTR